MSKHFEMALRDLAVVGLADADLTGPLLAVLPVSGASVATLGDVLGAETVAASDTRAARIDELQFDLSEGPCWDAFRSLTPVLAPDLLRVSEAAWPQFSTAMEQENVVGLFAFPLSFGPVRLGAIDLYTAEPVALDAVHVRHAVALAAAVSRHVFRRAIARTDDDVFETDTGLDKHSRRSVHQATGFVIAQIGVSADEAHLLLQAHAFALGRTMREVSDDVLAHILTFTVSANGIEVAP